MNMTGGVNREERCHTRLGTIGVSPRGALPTYIKEGEGGRQPRARPSRRNPTWAPSPIHPPLPYLDKGERKEGGGEGNRSPTSYFPFPPLLSLYPHVAGPIGGAPTPCGLVSLPPMAHMDHIFPRGVPVTPPVLRYVPDTLRNPSGVRILPSNISIFNF